MAQGKKRRGKRPTRETAERIRDSTAITLSNSHVSGVNDDATALKNIRDTADDRDAQRSTYGNAPGGTVALRQTMLQGMLDLADSYNFRVSEIAGGSHGPNSRHYAGIAFDIDRINGAPVNAGNPHFGAFMERAEELGATEVLGPGDPNHNTHVHAAWPRRRGAKQVDDPVPFCENSRRP